MQTLTHALALASAGFSVFPVRHVREDGSCECGQATCAHKLGKHPRCLQWQLRATTDEQTIRTWWCAPDAPAPDLGFEWECDPESNIGVALQDGMVVVDIDPRNGGLETAAELELLPGGLPQTRNVTTSNGGCHLYYRTPPGMQYPKTAGQGVDLKGKGGFVLGPPSIHKSLSRYAVEIEGPIVDAPVWLLALGTPRQERRTSARKYSESRDPLPAKLLAEADQVIALLEPAYVEGSKHAIATSFGSYCKKNGKSEAFVEYVVGMLPSDDPETRVESALTFYSYNDTAGWKTLEKHLPKETLQELEKQVSGKRKALSLTLLRKDKPALVIIEPGQNPLDALAEADDRDADVPPLDYLCEYFGIAEGKVSLFGGFAGSGKSPLGLLFGVCVAAGIPYLGQQTGRPRPVTFLMYEGERLSRIRRQRICRALGIRPGAIPLELRRMYQGFSTESIAIIRDAALWYRDANNGQGMVFLHDTYTSAMRGVDQNSAEYADALWALGDMGDETGAVNIPLAHFKKSKDGETDLQMLSGHNAIASAAQTVLGLLPNKKQPEEITIHPTRVPETAFKPTTVVWSDVPDPECKHDNALLKAQGAKWGLACAVREDGPTKEADPRERIATEICDLLRAAPMGLALDTLLDNIKGGTNMIKDVIKELTIGKHIHSHKNGLRKWYKLGRG